MLNGKKLPYVPSDQHSGSHVLNNKEKSKSYMHIFFQMFVLFIYLFRININQNIFVNYNYTENYFLENRYLALFQYLSRHTRTHKAHVTQTMCNLICVWSRTFI